MPNRFYAAVVLVLISMAAQGLDAPRLAAQGRGPSFTLGFRGDDVVINGSSLPQVRQVICTLTTAGLEVDQPGAQGWSFGVQPRGACWIADYSTIGMSSGTVALRGMVQAAGFERTDILDDGAGIIQGVVLSFTTPTTLSPADSPHDLLALSVGTDAPRGEDCHTCSLAYVGGLQGEGQPVQLVTTWNGETYRPQHQNKEIQICPPAACFEQGEIGDWISSSGPAASGAARANAAGRIEICGHGSGYDTGTSAPGGQSTDNVNVVGQGVPANYDFRLDARVRRMSGEDAYGGLEVRSAGVNTAFDPSASVLALGVRLDGDNQLRIEGFARGYVVRQFPAPVRLEELPVDLRIERRDGVLIGSYSTGGRFAEFIVATASGIQGSHFNPDARLHAALAQGSYGPVAEGRLGTATVYFGDPSLEIDRPPPPPPTPSMYFTPGQLELVGEAVDSIVSVRIAGLEATIVNKEGGRATINIPEADSPVRGDVVIDWGDSTSLIRNAFFSYGTGFIRGDCNDDGKVDISDAIKIFGYLFLGEDACVCLEATNSNGDPDEDISDGIYLLAFLFSGGSPPPPPYPDRGFSEDSDPANICGMEEHLPVITDITVVGREGAAAGDEPVAIEEGSRLRIDGRNFSSDIRRNTVVAGDARFEIVDATPNRLLVDVIRIATARILDIGIIRDFSASSSTSCFEDDCPPAIIGPFIIFDKAFELQPSNVGVIGESFPNERANGLVLQLDRGRFSPNASVAGMEISIDAMLDIPVVGGVSPGARRVSVTEVFPRTGPTSGADGVRRVADSLRRGLSGGGRLSEVRVIPDVERSRILIEPTVDILSMLRDADGAAAGPAFSAFPFGVISVYDQPIGRCGPNNLHPIDDERAFGWCRFEELVEECDGLPAFEYFFTHDETHDPSDVPENLLPEDRSPGSKEVMYNLAAYCHIRENRLWCAEEYIVLAAAGETEIPPFPRDAWVLKTSWVHETDVTSPLAGAATSIEDAADDMGYDGLNGNPTLADFKARFYSYVYSGNDPNHPGWPAGRYYLRTIHHTTKDIDDWFWYDAYVWAGQDDINEPQPNAGQEPKIGGCGGSSLDAPANILNHPDWGEYRLCTNVTNSQRDPGPYQVPEPSGADVGPQPNGDPSAFCGNFLIGVEVPNGGGFNGGGFNGGNSGGYDTCLNCHEDASRSGLTTDFLFSLTAGFGRVDTSCISVSNVTFSTHIEPILDSSCASCHDGAGVNLPGSMDLSTGNSYASIVGIISEQGNPPSGLGMMRIAPNVPDDSYLLHKINGTHLLTPAGGSGSSMPPFGSALPAQIRDDFEEWIMSGAPNN